MVVAAGEGRRFGGPKQYEVLGAQSVLAHSVVAARAVAEAVVAVVPPSRAGDPSAGQGADHAVPGGATRSESVRAGLAVVPAGVDVVVVHDAARPLASPALFRAVVDAVAAGAPAAIPGLAIHDTIKRVEGGVVVETLDRAALVAVQTPQAFRTDALRDAHVGDGEATDDAALLEQLGHAVAVVPGEASNFKLTTADDLALAAQRLAELAALAP